MRRLPGPKAGLSRLGHHAARAKGFTLLEILVAVSLLSFIVLGLFAMFNQTQRAFRSSMTQSDILEAGRAVAQMIPRDLEQMTAGYRGGLKNFTFEVLGGVQPLTQNLPGAIAPNKLVRTNFLEDVFLLLRDNQTWVGIGYCVRLADTNGVLWLPEASPGQLGAGTLYRYTATLPFLYPSGAMRGLPQDPGVLYTAFRQACVSGSAASTNINNRICDGVVHFQFRTFATNGFPIFSDTTRTNGLFATNGLANGWVPVQQTRAFFSAVCPDNVLALDFYSNALPAVVEMELGLLEQYSYERYASIGSPAARLAYLQREETSTRVHLFRERVPIRNVDPSAY